MTEAGESNAAGHALIALGTYAAGKGDPGRAHSLSGKWPDGSELTPIEQQAAIAEVAGELIKDILHLCWLMRIDCAELIEDVEEAFYFEVSDEEEEAPVAQEAND